MKQLLIIILCQFLIISCATNQSKSLDNTSMYIPVDKDLFTTIAEQDSLLFAAFNSRNSEKLKSFFSDDIEVFQDNIGVRDYNETIDAFQLLFQKEYVLTRTLVKNSMEVYPIKDFGAIQTGKHTFCHTENGKLECATFKFVQIWEKKNNKWQIIKIITYGH